MISSAADTTVEYGYDATFVEEVREEWKCTICHLVLRDPVQIVACGHCFCSPCYQRMKEHAQQSLTRLVCPVDREVIPPDQVFPDRRIARTIGNLKVKCSHYGEGCAWEDDLRDHGQKCKHGVVIEEMSRMSIHQNEEDRVMIKQILSRLDKCENDSFAKEKQMASMKVTVEELRAELKVASNAMKSLDTTNEELSKRVEYLESNVAHIEAVKEETEVIKSKVDVLELKQNTTDNVPMPVERISSLEQNMDQVKTTLGEVTSTKLTKIKNDMEMFRANTQEQLSNLESVMFMHEPAPNKDIVLQWVMKNYKQRRDIGDEVVSPMFSSIDGYRLKLIVEWLGKKK